MLTGFWSDIRYSTRTLARNPGFAAAAIVTIGLGVGVNVGIFTVLNGLVFRDLPARDADELVTVSLSQTIDLGSAGQSMTLQGPFSTSQYRVLRDRMQTLSGLLGNSDPTRTTLGGENPEQLIGTIVTCDYFDVLGQPVALGRALTARDCETGAPPVVVLSNELWMTTFGGDRAIVGRTVELNRQPFTVVGVAAAGTYSGLGLYRTAYFAPISAEPLLLPGEQSYDDDTAHWLSLIGRRDASLEQVRAEAGLLATQLDRLEPGRSTRIQIARATPLPDFLRVAALAVGGVVMTAFALVLLIACANVANLLLARATARGREIALRLSLGASRARVIRQLLAESLIISVAGGALGSVLALSTFPAVFAAAIRSVSPVGIPPMILDARPDFRVLWFTLAVTLLTGVLFGLAPAMRASKPDLHRVIKQDSPGAGSRRGGRLQGVLVGVQVAVCMVLMIATGLLLRGLGATQSIDPGFDYEDVAVASYDLEASGYSADEAASFQRRLLADVRALPGVEAAAYGAIVPLGADNESARIRLPGDERFRALPLNVVTPAFFDVVGLPIVRGRAFDGPDLQDSFSEIVVTESTARNLWPGRDPIGQTLTMAFGLGSDETVATVVGVVRDAQVSYVGQTDPYYAYIPATPRAASLLKLLVKSRADFTSTAASIGEAVQALDAGVVAQVVPLEANLDYWRNISGMVTTLAGALGLLALALASVGIFGVVAYFVARRTREIGIRMAFGAQHRDVLAMIVKRTMLPVVIGAAIGIVAAAGVSGVLSSVLFGVSALDPVGVAGAALCVLGVAFIAALIPGRRAAQTEPIEALRYE